MYALGFTLFLQCLIFGVIAEALKDRPADKYYYFSAGSFGFALAIGLPLIAWPLSGQTAPFWGIPPLALVVVEIFLAIYWRRRYVVACQHKG